MTPPRPYRDHDLRTLQSRLSGLLEAPVSLTLTDNSRSMISVKQKNREYRIRLHHMFLAAGESTLQALARYALRGSASLRKRLQAFIQRHAHKVKTSSPPPRPRRTRIKHRGKVFDLLEAYRRINTDYFQGEIDCAITWGNRRAPGTRSLRLGSYASRSGIIRINPLLDDPSVPIYVLDSVIHHEMLHHYLGARKRGGRTLYHHEDFRSMERTFSDRERAKAWIREDLPRLIRRKQPSS
jgi:DNA-binding transcriptional LysR family regulator